MIILKNKINKLFLILGFLIGCSGNKDGDCIKVTFFQPGYEITDDYEKNLSFANKYLKSVNASRAVVECGKSLAGLVENPIEFVLSVICVESNFDSSVIGKSGEIGLMQISPRWVDLDRKFLMDEYVNICIGVEKLKKEFFRYGAWDMVLVSYNTGSNKLWNKKIGKEYVERFLKCKERIK